LRWRRKQLAGYLRQYGNSARFRIFDELFGYAAICTCI
jgi:hypothetical protein